MKNNIYKVFAGLLTAVVLMCAAVVGKVALEPEQTEAETETEAEPLVINTVDDQDDMLLTVVREYETVFQYEGKVKIWRGTDGKNYAILHLNEEVLQ